MIVKCIRENENRSIKNGTHYEVLDTYENFYLIKNDNGVEGEYFQDRFEVIKEEVAPELDFQIDEFIVLEDFPIIEKKEEVKDMRSLRERVMGRVDYKSIAMAIWDRLEDEIVEELACSFDEDEIVEDMISEYRNDYIDVAKEVIIEEFYEDISSSEIEDHIKDIAREKAYE